MDLRSDEDLYLTAYFQELYDRHGSPLFRFIYRFTLNREIAEEILHDIFMQLFCGKYTPNGSGSLKSWLYTVARNRSLNHLKHAAFEIKSDFVVESAPAPCDLESQVRDADRARELTLAETRLPSDLQETWRLKKQGLNYEQIAAHLSIPVGTVKSRFHRLIKHQIGRAHV